MSRKCVSRHFALPNNRYRPVETVLFPFALLHKMYGSFTRPALAPAVRFIASAEQRLDHANYLGKLPSGRIIRS